MVYGSDPLPLPCRDRALTEAYGIFLLILLIGISVVLIIAVSGVFVTTFLQKPPVFAVQAKVSTPVPDKSVIILYHLQGDPVALANASGPASSPGVFVTLESPDGEKIPVAPSPVTTGKPWADGGTVIIYYDGSQFWDTDNFSAVISGKGTGGITGIPPGIWIIYISDQQTQVVVNSLAVTA